MAERVAGLEAMFAALTARLDRQVERDDALHERLTRAITGLAERQGVSERQMARWLGAATAIMIAASFLAPIVSRAIGLL